MQQTTSSHPQLEKLILPACDISDQGLHYISSGFTNLIYLSLPNCWRITSVGIGHVARMKSLRELHLHNCQSIDDECVRLLSEAESQITILDLSRNCKIGDIALKYLGESQLPIQELSLACCGITDEGIQHLVKQRKTLKRLSIFGCEKITDNSLRLIAEKLPSLEYIELSQSRVVTQEGIQHMKQRSSNLKVIQNYKAIG